MGFYCDLDGEDRITLDRDELAVAEWFNRARSARRSGGCGTSRKAGIR
mgnify:CR=1 FL=1